MRWKLVFGLALLVAAFVAGQTLKYRPQFPTEELVAAEQQYQVEEPNLVFETEAVAEPAPAAAPALRRRNTPVRDEDEVAAESIKDHRRDLNRLVKDAISKLSMHYSDLLTKKITPPAREVKLLKALADFDAALQEFETDGRISKIASELEEVVKQSPRTDAAKKAAAAIEALKAQPQPEKFQEGPLESKKLSPLDPLEEPDPQP